MKTEEAKKNIQETLSKLESFNRDSDPVFSSLLQVLSSLITIIDLIIHMKIAYFSKNCTISLL